MLNLTDEAWAQMCQVNSNVNMMPARTDQSQWGESDHWAPIARSGGDCEDYALEKRHQLHDMGFPGSALKLATCWEPSGGYHCVLMVDAEREGQPGTWVLDNLQADPMAYNDMRAMGYRFDKRHGLGPTGWVRIEATE